MTKKTSTNPKQSDLVDLNKVTRFSPQIKDQLRNEIGNRLKCPSCGTSVMLMASGIICQSPRCNSKIMTPLQVLGERPYQLGQWTIWLLLKLYPHLESHSPADAKAENRLAAKPRST